MKIFNRTEIIMGVAKGILTGGEAVYSIVRVARKYICGELTEEKAIREIESLTPAIMRVKPSLIEELKYAIRMKDLSLIASIIDRVLSEMTAIKHK